MRIFISKYFYDILSHNDILRSDIMTLLITKQIYTFNSIHNTKLY